MSLLRYQIGSAQQFQTENQSRIDALKQRLVEAWAKGDTGVWTNLPPEIKKLEEEQKQVQVTFISKLDNFQTRLDSMMKDCMP
jgi:hypothetical protein